MKISSISPNPMFNGNIAIIGNRADLLEMRQKLSLDDRYDFEKDYCLGDAYPVLMSGFKKSKPYYKDAEGLYILLTGDDVKKHAVNFEEGYRSWPSMAKRTDGAFYYKGDSSYDDFTKLIEFPDDFSNLDVIA